MNNRFEVLFVLNINLRNENKESSDKAMQMAHTDAQNQKIMMNAIADRLRILGVNLECLHSGNIQKYRS